MKRGLLAGALLLSLTACLAANNAEPLFGVWGGGDHASESIYGTLTISSTHVSWAPNNPFNNMCKVGDTFPGQLEIFRHQKEERSYTTLKLKLASHSCTDGVAYMQFSVPSEIPNYLDFVPYNESNQQLGWMHFHRIAPVKLN